MGSEKEEGDERERVVRRGDSEEERRIRRRKDIRGGKSEVKCWQAGG